MRLIKSCRRALVAAAIVGSGLALAEPQRAGADQHVPFSQPLRIPRVYRSANIDIAMREACIPVFPGPCTKMWTYDGMFPGPTIRRPSGKLTRVTFANNLPTEVGSTTVHHHGNHSESKFDGQPDHYLIEPGKSFTYEYDFMEAGEPERAAFQWYHDHRMDVTGRNVWMGLAGMVVLDDRFDAALPLPKGEYDVPLMIVDRTFDENNQLVYSFNSGGNHGDHILVNGVPSPYFDVADRKYRLRLLNASNAREYKFELSNGQEMIHVASESGLLPQPVRRTSIVLGPAERAEVVVDFAGRLGQEIVMSNTNPSINPLERAPVPSNVMQFRVRKHAPDRSSVPQQLRPAPHFGTPVMAKRVFSLGVVPGAGALHREDDVAPQKFLWTINGRTFDHRRVDADPKLGSTERWVFTNNTNGQHRVHIHDVDWKIVSRTGGIKLLTPGDPDVALGEAGLKETFLVQSWETVEVESTFTDRLGKYVFHCHVLEHEDNGMMAQFEVMPTDGAAAPAHGSGTSHDHGDAAHDSREASLPLAHGDASPSDAAADDARTPKPASHPIVEVQQTAEHSHAPAASNSRSRGDMAKAVAIVILGLAAGAATLQPSRAGFSRLAAAALGLQLVGLGWDMAIHARSGQPMDLFENAGHLVAMGGIVLLALVVALPSISRVRLAAPIGTSADRREETAARLRATKP